MSRGLTGGGYGRIPRAQGRSSACQGSQRSGCAGWRRVEGIGHYVLDGVRVQFTGGIAIRGESARHWSCCGKKRHAKTLEVTVERRWKQGDGEGVESGAMSCSSDAFSVTNCSRGERARVDLNLSIWVFKHKEYQVSACLYVVL